MDTGKVSVVFPERATARVMFDDVGMVSKELFVMVHRAVGQKDYWMPKLGDTVVCLFLPNGSDGFIVGSYYGENDLLPGGINPSPDDDIRAVELENGNSFVFDGKKNELVIDGDNDLNIIVKTNINITLQNGAEIIQTKA